jgi:hypothetical protein
MAVFPRLWRFDEHRHGPGGSMATAALQGRQRTARPTVPASRWATAGSRPGRDRRPTVTAATVDQPPFRHIRSQRSQKPRCSLRFRTARLAEPGGQYSPPDMPFSTVLDDLPPRPRRAGVRHKLAVQQTDIANGRPCWVRTSEQKPLALPCTGMNSTVTLMVIMRTNWPAS